MPTGHAWKRPLHGTIVANARRSGGAPIRLQTGQNEAVEEASATSVLGELLTDGGGKTRAALRSLGEISRRARRDPRYTT